MNYLRNFNEIFGKDVPIILKDTKKQGLTLSLEETYFEKLQSGGVTLTPHPHPHPPSV